LDRVNQLFKGHPLYDFNDHCRHDYDTNECNYFGYAGGHSLQGSVLLSVNYLETIRSKLEIKFSHHRTIGAISKRFKYDRVNVDAETVNRAAGHDKVGRS